MARLFPLRSTLGAIWNADFENLGTKVQLEHTKDNMITATGQQQEITSPSQNVYCLDSNPYFFLDEKSDPHRNRVSNTVF